MKKLFLLTLTILMICTTVLMGQIYPPVQINTTIASWDHWYFAGTNIYYNSFNLGGTTGTNGYFIWNGIRYDNPFFSIADGTNDPITGILGVRFFTPTNSLISVEATKSNNYANLYIDDQLVRDEFSLSWNCIGSISNHLDKLQLDLTFLSNNVASKTLFTGPGTTGLVTSITSDLTKFLRGDGVWADVIIPPAGITISSSGKTNENVLEFELEASTDTSNIITIVHATNNGKSTVTIGNTILPDSTITVTGQWYGVETNITGVKIIKFDWSKGLFVTSSNAGEVFVTGGMNIFDTPIDGAFLYYNSASNGYGHVYGPRIAWTAGELAAAYSAAQIVYEGQLVGPYPGPINGHVYMAITNIIPPFQPSPYDTTYFRVFVRQGYDGVNGAKGDKGDPGTNGVANLYYGPWNATTNYVYVAGGSNVVVSWDGNWWDLIADQPAGATNCPSCINGTNYWAISIGVPDAVAVVSNFVLKGVWSSLTQYYTNDLVSYLDNEFVVLITNQQPIAGEPPQINLDTNSSSYGVGITSNYWTLWRGKGYRGLQGLKGADGTYFSSNSFTTNILNITNMFWVVFDDTNKTTWLNSATTSKRIPIFNYGVTSPDLMNYYSWVEDTNISRTWSQMPATQTVNFANQNLTNGGSIQAVEFIGNGGKLTGIVSITNLSEMWTPEMDMTLVLGPDGMGGTVFKPSDIAVYSNLMKRADRKATPASIVDNIVYLYLTNSYYVVSNMIPVVPAYAPTNGIHGWVVELPPTNSLGAYSNGVVYKVDLWYDSTYDFTWAGTENTNNPISTPRYSSYIIEAIQGGTNISCY